MFKIKGKIIINNIIAISSLSFLFVVPVAMITNGNNASNPIFNNSINKNIVGSSQHILNSQKFITNKSQVSSDGQYVFQESDNSKGIASLQIISNNGYVDKSEQNLKRVDGDNYPARTFHQTITHGKYDIDRDLSKNKDGDIGTSDSPGLFLSGHSTNPLDIFSWNSTQANAITEKSLTGTPILPCYRLLPIGKTLSKSSKPDDSHINVVSDAAFQHDASVNSDVNNAWFSFSEDFAKSPQWQSRAIFNNSPYPYTPLNLTNLVTTPDGIIYFTSRVDSRDLGAVRDGNSVNYAPIKYSSDEYYFFVPYNSDDSTHDFSSSKSGSLPMWFDQNDMSSHSLTSLKNTTTNAHWPGLTFVDKVKWKVIDSVYANGELYLLLLNKDDNQSYIASANLTISNNQSTMSLDKISKDFCFTPTTLHDKSKAGVASTIYEINNGHLLVSNSNGSYRIYDKNLKPLNDIDQKAMFTDNYYTQAGYNTISQALPLPGAGEYTLSINSESPYLYYIPEDGKSPAKKVIDLNIDSSIDLENAYHNFSNLSSDDINKTKIITSINFIRNKNPNWKKYENTFLQINTGYTDPNDNVLSWIARIDPNNPTNLKIIGTGYDYIVNEPQISTSASLYLKSKQIISNFDYKPTKAMIDTLNKEKENGDVKAKTFRQDFNPSDPSSKLHDLNIEDYFNDCNDIITTDNLTKTQISDGWFYINLWTGDKVLAQLEKVSFGNPTNGTGNNTTLPIDLTININSHYGGGIPSVTTKVVRINSFDSFTPVINNNQIVMLPYIIGTSVAAGVLLLIVIFSYLIWRNKKIKENINYIKTKRKTRFELRSGKEKTKHDVRKEAKKTFRKTFNSEAEKPPKLRETSTSFFTDKKTSRVSKNNRKLESSSVVKDLSYDSLQNTTTKYKSKKKNRTKK